MPTNKDRIAGIDRPAFIHGIYNQRTLPEQYHRIDEIVKRRNFWKDGIGNATLSIFSDELLRPKFDLTKQVGRLYRNWALGASPDVQDAMTALVTQTALAQLKRTSIDIPQNIQKVSERILNAFLFYTDLLVEQTPGIIGGIYRYVQIAERGDVFTEALSIFTPAYLGITPSSAVKLFKDRLSGIPKEKSKEAEIISTRAITQAYREEVLPVELEELQHYNPEHDMNASQFLLHHYEEQNLSAEEQVRAYDKSQELLRDFDSYRNLISSDVHSSSLGWRTIQLPPGNIASSIDITQQNAKVHMFVLHLTDAAATPLTLEIGEYVNRAGERSLLFYGIPPQVNRENPHLREMILRDILIPINEYGRSLMPEKKERAREAVRQPGGVRRTTSQTELKQRVVIHSRKKVSARIGGEMADEETVNKIMADIKDFEKGSDQKFKPLEIQEGLYEILSDQFIAVVRDLENQRYVLEEVVHRKDLNKTINRN